jgi:hypothetical protein
MWDCLQFNYFRIIGFASASVWAYLYQQYMDKSSEVWKAFGEKICLYRMTQNNDCRSEWSWNKFCNKRLCVHEMIYSIRLIRYIEKYK